MVRQLFLTALLALFAVTLSAEVDSAARSTYYKPKCPCKCFIKYKADKAVHQCKKKKFIYKCEVLPCKKGYYEGKWCCDKKPKPSVTPTKSPKPSVTPSPSPKKKPCPCKCTKKKIAKKECYYLPYCKIIKCPTEEVKPGYGYYKPKKEFKCCDKYY